MATIERVGGLNQQIIQILQANPSTTNKEIGDRLDISEITVAARIRSMEDDKILRVMMQRDVRSLGYDVIALVDINIEGRRPEEVAADLALIDECVSVSLSFSSPDIILHVSARDNLHVQQIVEQKIAPVSGIFSYEITMAIEVVKMDNRYGGLDAE